MTCPLCHSPECNGPTVTPTLNGQSIQLDPRCECPDDWRAELDALCDAFTWVPPAAVTRSHR